MLEWRGGGLTLPPLGEGARRADEGLGGAQGGLAPNLYCQGFQPWPSSGRWPPSPNGGRVKACIAGLLRTAIKAA